MHVEDIRTLFSYNAWANEQILDAAARLPPEKFATASLGARSLQETLRHTMMVEAGWLSDWQGVDHETLEFPDSFPTVEMLRSRWREEAEKLQTFLDALRNEDLPRLIPRPIGTWTLEHQMQHVVYHGMQHRSEVAMLLTDLGESPGWLDFLVYLRDYKGTP